MHMKGFLNLLSLLPLSFSQWSPRHFALLFPSPIPPLLSRDDSFYLVLS